MSGTWVVWVVNQSFQDSILSTLTSSMISGFLQLNLDDSVMSQVPEPPWANPSIFCAFVLPSVQ